MALLPYALTDVATVKEHMGITGTQYDAVLEALVNAATEYIERYCRRRFKDEGADKVEYISGNGSVRLHLSNYPANSITKLEQKTDFDSWEVIDTADYVLGSDGMYITLHDGTERGDENYRITYQAGYTTIPADLEQACIQLVVREFNQRGGEKGAVESEQIGDYRISYLPTRDANSNKSGDAFIDATLARYKKIKV